MLNLPSSSHSPRSSAGLGTDAWQSDFLGVPSPDNQLQELDIFDPQYEPSRRDESDMPLESESSSASFSTSDFSPWMSSPRYHSNSLHLIGTAPASSVASFTRLQQPLHDSYFGTAQDSFYADSLIATRPVPRIHIDTEFHASTVATASHDPRSPAAYERSPTALIVTPTSFSHSSPASSSFPPATPQTPFNGSPFGTPFIKQASNSPYSPFNSFSPELTVQPSALEDTFCPPTQREREHADGSHRVLPLAQMYSHPLGGELVPQPDYRPHTQSDRRRYVEQVHLEAPILFFMASPSALGIPLKDALSSRFMHLQGRDDPMFEGRGPSVSIRLNWPGYAPWSRQIPTRDFRSPPHPVTRAKLARNVAKTIKRFIDEMNNRPMEDNSQVRWRVGSKHIKYEDLLLVGLQHVSMGSWQAHVRLMHRR